MSPYRRVLLSQMKILRQVASESIYWALPLTLGGAWLVWPALDQEWLMSMGLAADPEATVKRVQAEKIVRLEAYQAAHPSKSKKEAEEEEEEEEAQEEEEAEEEEGGDEEEEDGGGDDEEEGEEGDKDEEDEEDDDEEENKVKPLYMPNLGKKLKSREIWDNFTLKAVKMNDDDDDDEEDEDDDDDDDE